MLLGFVSCDTNKTFKSKEEMLRYLKEGDNNYMQYKTVNGIDFSLLYRPTDLLVSQEIEGEQVETSRIDSLREHYGKYLYFNLGISKHNKDILNVLPKNQAEYGALVNQLAFGMRNKVHLFTQNRDTIPLVDFIFPRMYGMSKSTNIMLVFSKDEKKMSTNFLNLTIGDMKLNTGEIKFKISSDHIKNEPQLSFKKLIND